MATPNNKDQAAEQRDEENKRRFVDQSGLEASELPNGGRGTNQNERQQDMQQRNLPQQHGGEQLDSDADDFTGRSEGGLRGDRQMGDAKHWSGGGRGKN